MNQIDKKIEQNLHTVQKPARYTGGELNIIIKETPQVRMAVSYPDLYEVGMSNNGIKILYDIANKYEDAACERVFAVAPDFEALLIEHDVPLYTLETCTPLYELDCIGFNLAHELLMTNILQILQLGRIPLERKDRSENDPIIIAGGEAGSNPLPWSMFFDLVFIGDGEVGMPLIVEKLLYAKKNDLTRSSTIALFTPEQGFFNPDLYEYKKNDEGFYMPHGPDVVKQRCKTLKDTDPLRPLVSNIRIAQERAVIEMTRGCKNLCKFCHAGYYELPYRKSDASAVFSKVTEIIDNTGFDGITLSSLSLSDYRELVSVLNELIPYCNERGISISLPSLKVDPASLPVIEAVSDLRKTSLTFAVESAAEDMRRRANKRVLTEELLSIVSYVRQRGWRHIKLYFMLGLPGWDETDEAQDIIDLIKSVRSAAKGLAINVTLSPFIPKPHTPFQWEQQQGADYFNEKVLQIKQGLPLAVKIKNHVVTSSMLEGFFSRGDHTTGAAVFDVFNRGGRLDSWSEYHDFNFWKDSLPENWQRFLGPRGHELPWGIIKTGREHIVKQHKERDFDISRKSGASYTEQLDTAAASNAFERFKEKYDSVETIRCSFSKTGTAKFISHLDFIEIIKRALRMAHVPVTFTQGFNKHEKISAAFPLPLGIESNAELVDVELYEIFESTIVDAVNAHLPQGIYLNDMQKIERGKSLMALIDATEYVVYLPEANFSEIIKANIAEKPEFIKRGKKKERVIDFESAVMDITLSEKEMKLLLQTGTETSIRIDEALSVLLNRDPEMLKLCRVIKTAHFHQGAQI